MCVETWGFLRVLDIRAVSGRPPSPPVWEELNVLGFLVHGLALPSDI